MKLFKLSFLTINKAETGFARSTSDAGTDEAKGD